MRGTTARRAGRWLLTLDVLAVLFVGGYLLVDMRLDRVDAVADHPQRPTDGPGQDWLLVGSERLGAGRRIDTLLLLHIAHDGDRPTLIALPPMTYTPVQGHGRTTLEAAYAAGGPKLLTAGVESGTGVRIDRYLEYAAHAPGVRPDPSRGVAFFTHVAGSMTVDEGDHVHQLVRLAHALHRVGTGDVVRTTLPIGQFTSIAGLGPVALTDDVKIHLLATAIAADRPLPADLLAT